MTRCINCYQQHSAMPVEERTSSQWLTVTLTIPFAVYIQEIFLVTNKESSFRSVMRNTHFHSHFREAQRQVLAEICMPYSQLQNQPMEVELIYHLEILENSFNKIETEKYIKMIRMTNLKHINPN